MSSPEAPQSSGPDRLSRRSLLRGLAVSAISAPLLAACGDGTGFHPVYGSLGGSHTEEKLAKIQVTTIPGRNGQRIRNELMFANTGGGAAPPPEYRLDISLKESTQTTLVSADGNSAAQVFQLDVAFRLISLKDGRTLLQGSSHGRAA